MIVFAYCWGNVIINCDLLVVIQQDWSGKLETSSSRTLYVTFLNLFFISLLISLYSIWLIAYFWTLILWRLFRGNIIFRVTAWLSSLQSLFTFDKVTRQNFRKHYPRRLSSLCVLRREVLQQPTVSNYPPIHIYLHTFKYLETLWLIIHRRSE